MKLIDDLHVEMTERGFIYNNNGKVVDRETTDTVMAKYDLTKEQFDAIPGRNDRCPHCGRLISICASAQNCRQEFTGG